MALSLRGDLVLTGSTKQSRSDNVDKIATSRQVGTRNDKNLHISVSNSGPGIPEEQLDNIFDRFQQAGNNYKRDSEGTGTGLALVRELVEAHHGGIRVESPPQGPTVFTLTRPLTRSYFKEEEIAEDTHVRAKHFG